MAIEIDKLKAYFIERVNPDDVSAVENVDRYIKLIEFYREMSETIDEDGVRTVVDNGNQSYIKSHPLISDMKNINAQLINLKKDIDKSIKEYEIKLAEEEKAKEYTSEDLI